MKIKNYFRYAALASVALLAISCSKEEVLPQTPVNTDGEEVMVDFTYKIQSMTVDGVETLDATTRTVPSGLDANDGATVPIKNMFILQFDGLLPTSQMLGAPRFLSEADLAASPLSVPLISKANPCYTVFVANVKEGVLYNWNMSTQSTFSDVVKRIKTMSVEADNYETLGDPAEQTIMLSAVTKTPVVVGTPLTPVFKRDVAKVTLNLALDNPEMTITSVRLRNVSKSIALADAAIAEVNGGTEPAIYPADVTVMDYDAVTTGLPTSTTAVPFTWYVPRNHQGINTSSTNFKDKTFYAPNHATYFEIIAKKVSGGTTTSCVFRVYPGANQVDDYNITPNNHYTIGLTVKDDGTDINDSRVETFRDVDMTAIGDKSNSFIINPAPAGGATIRYNIPITQVNRYWGNNYAGYGNTPANVIGDSDTWTTELIWCDTDNLFDVNYNASLICLTNVNGGNAGTGTGPSQYFQLQVPAGMPSGNFTIGLRKNGGDILWSWHFWVTDYNPNKFNKSVIESGRYTYPVPGGQVERYVDGAGYSVWSGRYADRVMMDRALGATENYFTKTVSASNNGTLHYQFGRKDPFPLKSSLATGSKAVVLTDAKVAMKTSVTSPNTFYFTSVTGGNWNTDSELVNNLSMEWHDPQASPSGDKSIYDPCPPGWRMPINGTWSDFNRSFDGSFINVQNSLRDLAWNYGRGIDNINGLRYWPSSDVNSKTSPVEGRIWYPATGYRASTSGLPGALGSYGYYWSSSLSSTTAGYYLYFYSGAVYPQYSYYRAYGFSARCVAE